MMKLLNTTTAAVIYTLLVVSFAPLHAENADGLSYHLARTIPLDGDASWDYLSADSAARRLYVTHYDHVAVLDIDSGELIGKIPGLLGVHGVAVDPDSGRGFASDGKTDSIVMFDLKSLAVLGRLPAGDNPDAIIYDPFSRRIYAFNHSGGDVTVINGADGSPAGTAAVGGELEYGVTDGNGSVFVNVEDRSEIVRIETSTLDVTGRWPLAPCEEPTGLAMDVQSRRLFSACHNGILAILDADNGHVVTSVPIGHGCDGVRFEPETGLIFTSNGEGTLSIIHEDSADGYVPVATVPTKRGARTLEIDLPTHRVFTATAALGPIPEDRAGRHGRPSIVPNSFAVLEFSR